MLAAEVAVLAMTPFRMLAKNSLEVSAKIRAAGARKPACTEASNPSSTVVKAALRATKQLFHAHTQPLNSTDAKTILFTEVLDP
jgi:hypothetical protein